MSRPKPKIDKCCRCGECCRWIAFGMAYGGADWNEYYFHRGCKIETPGPGLLVPSICPHLKQDGDKFLCDIYETRPALCRYNNAEFKSAGGRFWHPKGCTDK